MNEQTMIQQIHCEEFGSLAILMINEAPWFPATESARILGYTNPRKAIRDHCRRVANRSSPTNGGLQVTNYIPEGDLYRLIIRSKLPSAERFERWICDQVLPDLRRHGTYIEAYPGMWTH